MALRSSKIPFPLPQELVDLIIDFVVRLEGIREIRRTLPVCALVCRAWLPRSRLHFFQRCLPKLRPWDIFIFQDLLQSPYSTFRSHMRRISFSSVEPHDRSLDEILLHANLHCLENLRTLEIDLYTPSQTTIVDSFCAKSCMAFPTVTSLELSSYIGLPLIDLICCFPALQELCIHEMRGIVPYSTSNDCMPPQGLRCLKLVAQSLGPILAWLHTSEHLPIVDSLTLHGLRRDYVKIVRAALQRLGSAIHHLEIRLDVDFQKTGGAYQSCLFDPSSSTHKVNTLALFDLSLHPELKFLSIRDSSYGFSDAFSPKDVLPLIKMLAAPKLEQLELELNQRRYQASDWIAMDRLLRLARFPRLQTVVLAPNYLCDHEHLRAVLPSLDASGMLKPRLKPL
ncbi:hypothetical protein C8R45DRAFT_482452 [Mycena sanguinolenta]|nr:hypothetical protein C8R45DRAFT_482452 [Mycena sanguinolenta]